MTGKAYLAAASALAAMVLTVPAGSQTAAPAGKPPASRPASAIPQPPELIRLAEKARTLKAVHAKGAGHVDTSEDLKLPPEMKKVDFEVWVVPPACKVRVALPEGLIRVSDGRHVYTCRPRPGARAEGRRRRITPQNFYNVLDMAAVYCDGANGYANLIAQVRFQAVPALPRHARKFPKLQWFLLHAVAKPPHHLLAGTESVRVGISPADGLMRVMVADKKIDREKVKGRVVVTVIFGQVVHGKVRPENLMLPPAAAEAAWTDADTGKPMAVPKAIIAPKK